MGSDELALKGWARRHAAGLVLAGGVSLLVDSPLPATGFGVLSLLALVFHHRGRWTHSGVFGAANAVTSVRLAMVAGLCALGFWQGLGPLCAMLVLTIFALDGLDGWLAKRTGHSSVFGAAFDMECDALLVLVCALLLYLRDRLGAYILIPGFLRYAYALGIGWLPHGGVEVPPSRIGRYAFSVFAVSVIVSLWPIAPVYEPFAMFATALLIWSFGRGLLWSIKHSFSERAPASPHAAPTVRPSNATGRWK